jgi:glycosyltransferase involved in cell wall biosynthesis
MPERRRTGTDPLVAFVLPSLNGGGAERAVLNLHHHSSIESRLILERAEGDLLMDPMAADAISLDLSEGATRFTRMARLARVLRRLRPSVVVAALSPWTVGLAAMPSAVRVIYWLQAPSYFMPGIQRDRQLLWGRVGLRTLALFADAIAGAAPGLTGEWAAAGIAPSKLTVLPNPIELDLLSPIASRGADSGVVRLLTVGRLAPEKRQDVLIHALARVRKYRAAELTIVGRGDREGALRGLAESLGLGASVHFAGFVTKPARYFAAADVFLLGSDFEGFGNVIVEALGHGLPVVCTDAPYGPRFIAGDCPAVRLVALGDSDAIADAVLSVLGEGARRWASEAQARAREFSVERVSAYFGLLIERLLDDRALPVWGERVPSGDG